jgi:uncharacterized protein (TIGR02271 family)
MPIFSAFNIKEEVVMNYTVVGIFDDKAEARRAMEELVRDGFVQENIDLSEANYAGDTSTTTSSTATTNQSTGDSISNFFSNLFSDDEVQARSYTNVARDADAILTVQADSQERAREVAAIFDRNGAIDVDERTAQYSQQQFSGTTGTEAHGAVDTQQNVSGGTVIPIIEEELQVGKREVEHGGVRVRSRVIEKPVEEHLRLREERIVVNRRPVNRAVTDADTANFQQGDFTITERAEEAVVSKQARVVEEVEVGKRVEEHDQVIRDTVRRTDVDVEEINTGTTRSETVTDVDIDNDNTARGAGR